MKQFPTALLCGSRKIEKSGAIVCPINWERPWDRFMFGFVMAECECSQCENWWSQPAGFSIIETSHREHGCRTPRRRLDLQRVSRRARAVSRIAPLRDDALKTHLMAGTEQLHRIIEVARELQMFAVG